MTKSQIANVTKLVRELLQLEAQVAPLRERLEKLKKDVRPYTGEHEIPGLGTVKVSEASERKFKGVELQFDAEVYDKLNEASKALLIEMGVVKTASVYTQARSAAVSIKLEQAQPAQLKAVS